MTNCKTIACLTAVACIFAACNTIQAFYTVSTSSSQRSVSEAVRRTRGGHTQSKIGISSTSDADGSTVSPSILTAAAVVGAGVVSIAAVKKSVNPSRAISAVPRRQAVGGVGVVGEFKVGQAVKVKIWNGEWHAGVVASTAPLKVKPNGWSDSHAFDHVIAITGSEVAGHPSVSTVQAGASSGVFDPSKQLGVTEPLGFFDPLGLSSGVDEQGFRHFRAAELKHGRVAMLASLGCVVQHHIAIPGFEDVPRGLGAFETFPASPIGLLLVGLASGYVEQFVWKEDQSRLPGDFGNPWCPIEGFEVTDDLRNKEINNGRLAMISMLGIIMAELATGRDGVEQIFGVSS